MSFALFNFRFNVEDRVIVVGDEADLYPGTWKVLEQLARTNGSAYKCIGEIGTGLLMGQTRIFRQDQLNVVGSITSVANLECICTTDQLMTVGCDCGEMDRERARKAAE